MTECDICEGHGVYPIIDRHGTERYAIRCPECGGSGAFEASDDGSAELDLPPASTAARIQSIDQLRAWTAREHGRTP